MLKRTARGVRRSTNLVRDWLAFQHLFCEIQLRLQHGLFLSSDKGPAFLAFTAMHSAAISAEREKYENLGAFRATDIFSAGLPELQPKIA